MSRRPHPPRYPAGTARRDRHRHRHSLAKDPNDRYPTCVALADAALHTLYPAATTPVAAHFNPSPRTKPAEVLAPAAPTDQAYEPVQSPNASGYATAESASTADQCSHRSRRARHRNWGRGRTAPAPNRRRNYIGSDSHARVHACAVRPRPAAVPASLSSIRLRTKSQPCFEFRGPPQVICQIRPADPHCLGAVE